MPHVAAVVEIFLARQTYTKNVELFLRLRGNLKVPDPSPCVYPLLSLLLGKEEVECGMVFVWYSTSTSTPLSAGVRVA